MNEETITQTDETESSVADAIDEKATETVVNSVAKDDETKTDDIIENYVAEPGNGKNDNFDLLPIFGDDAFNIFPE
jgi:hypothetical protein